MDIKIIARGSPNDDFFNSLFEECIKYIPFDSKVYFVWAEPLNQLESMLNKLDYDSPNVFLFIPDDLTDRCFIVGDDQRSYIGRILAKILNNNPQTNFTLVCDIANLHLELIEFNNIKIIESEFMALSQKNYQLIDPVINKDFKSESGYIMLAGMATRSRITALSYLYDQKLDSTGQILIGKSAAESLKCCPDYLTMVNWKFKEKHEHNIKTKILNGFHLLKSAHQNSQGFGMSGMHKNYINLDKNLRQYYLNSFVEIIGETYYEEPSFMITEKTLHSIHGCNFPIILSSPGTVKHLEDLGIDVFNDIIDHNYDNILDPVDRVVELINSNYKLLSDVDYAKLQWRRCQNRFLTNVDFVKNQLHKTVHQRVLNHFLSL